MTKREEISQWLYKALINAEFVGVRAGSEWRVTELVNSIVLYLHSKGVVIKVNDHYEELINV